MQFEQNRKTMVRISKRKEKNKEQRHLPNKNETHPRKEYIDECKDVMNTYIESDTPRKG